MASFCLTGRRARTSRAVAAALGVLLAAGSALAQEPATTQPDASHGAVSRSAQIGPATVASLAPLAAFPSGHPRGARLQAGPGGLLLALTAFPHALYALRPGEGRFEVAWTFRPQADRSVAAQACCVGGSEGGIGIAGDTLYLNTLDGRTVALETATGRVLWTARTAEGARGETLASAPVVAKGRLLVGNAGDDFGARGWLKALDAASGAELWTRYSTGPDAEVGIGPDFRPFYGERRPDDGVASWPRGAWQHGGGSVSGPILVDAALDLVFHGTGHPAPWNPDQRPGDNSYTGGLFARDAATGSARWFTALEPHDPNAYGATGPLMLLDKPWQGAPRKLLVHVGANGYVYVLDRLSGQILSATPFVPVTASRRVEPATGRPVREATDMVRVNTMVRDVCPSSAGATSANGAVLSPATSHLYIAANRLCMDLEVKPASYMRGTPFLGANLRLKPARGVPAGALIAWNVEAGAALWTRDEPFPLTGEPLATPAGLVVYGTLDGFLRALDARDGRLLWEHKLAAGAVGAPVEWQAGEGAPRWAVATGSSLGFGSTDEREIDTRDATAARGFANAVHDLAPPADRSGTVQMFGLP